MDIVLTFDFDENGTHPLLCHGPGAPKLIPSTVLGFSRQPNPGRTLGIKIKPWQD
jgi:hypothetical protein